MEINELLELGYVLLTIFGSAAALGVLGSSIYDIFDLPTGPSTNLCTDRHLAK